MNRAGFIGCHAACTICAILLEVKMTLENLERVEWSGVTSASAVIRVGVGVGVGVGIGVGVGVRVWDGWEGVAAGVRLMFFSSLTLTLTLTLTPSDPNP